MSISPGGHDAPRSGRERVNHRSGPALFTRVVMGLVGDGAGRLG
jgi:hypothetical protein